jgi:hypothetical protein
MARTGIEDGVEGQATDINLAVREVQLNTLLDFYFNLFCMLHL